MRLTLLRHGQTRSNVDRLLDTAYPGADLDEVGRAQAHALVDRLADHHFDGVFVSDLPRTRQTVEPLARTRQLPPVVLPGLREIQAGDYEMSADWVPFVTLMTRFHTEPSVRVPGGETGQEFLQRYDDAIASIETAGHEAPLVVTHGAAIRVWTLARCANIHPEHMPTLALANTTTVVLEGSTRTGWHAVSWAGQAIPQLVPEPAPTGQP